MTRIAVICLILSGCTATVGPYITDVQRGENDSLRIQRCQQSATTLFGEVIISTHDKCTWEERRETHHDTARNDALADELKREVLKRDTPSRKQEK